MHVTMLGTGSIGAILATFAKQSTGDNEVHLVGRPARLAPVARDGLVHVPHGSKGEVDWIRTSDYRVHDSVADVPATDVLFCSMKASVLDSGLREARHLLDGTRTVVVLAMNGLGVYELASRHVPPSRIVDTIPFYPSRLEGNMVTGTGGNAWFTAPETPVANQVLRDVFDGSGMDLRFDPAFEVTTWRKAIVNIAMNAISAMTTSTVGEVLATAPLVVIIKAIIAEAVAVASGLGVSLGGGVEDAFFAFASKDPDHRPSMQQDVARGKPTEINFLNGYIAREGERLGIPVPVNRAIVSLMHAIEGVAGRS